MPATPDERSPLLTAERDAEPNESSALLSDSRRNSESSHRNESNPSKPANSTKAWRWPSIVATVVLGAIVIVIIVLGFLLPPAIKTYAEHAVIMEPTNLALDSVTPEGVRAFVQGNFRIESSRVEDVNARRLGRLTAMVVRKLKSKETKIDVRLPRYDNALLGSAIVPPLLVDVLDGHNTELEFVANLVTGDQGLLRKVINDWLLGKLKELEISGETVLSVKSGIFPMGSHDLSNTIVLEGQSLYRSFASFYFGDKTTK